MPSERTTPQTRNFWPAQIDVLRTELARYAKGKRQADIAKRLRIRQQHVGRLLSSEKGFSYLTASRIARLAGYRGVDALFEAHGVALDYLDPSEDEPLENEAPDPITNSTAVFAARFRDALDRIFDDFGGLAALPTVARELGVTQPQLRKILRRGPDAIDIGVVIAVRAYLIAQEKARLVDEILGVAPTRSVQ